MDKELVSLVSIGCAILLGAMSPGASFLLSTRTALSSTPKASFAVSLGLGSGAMIFSIIALLGLQSIFLIIPWIHDVLRVIGGVYLLWVAFKMLFLSSKPESHLPELTGLTFKSAFLSGLFTQLSNPNTALVFASLFTTLLTEKLSAFVIFFIPIMTFFIDFTWFQIVAKLFSTEKMRESYLRYKRFFDKLCAGVMTFLGLKLIIER